jgi:hypothetical protein
MAPRWIVAVMLGAAEGFSRLKARSQLSQLRAGLLAHRQKADQASSVAQSGQPHRMDLSHIYAAPITRLGCLAFEGQGAFASQR